MTTTETKVMSKGREFEFDLIVDSTGERVTVRAYAVEKDGLTVVDRDIYNLSQIVDLARQYRDARDDWLECSDVDADERNEYANDFSIARDELFNAIIDYDVAVREALARHDAVVKEVEEEVGDDVSDVRDSADA